ncbi:hypothetical protein EPO15_09415 [bacterium]|nr:MAG: hypothetical protein EPO15_09415 [bacterium]
MPKGFLVGGLLLAAAAAWSAPLPRGVRELSPAARNLPILDPARALPGRFAPPPVRAGRRDAPLKSVSVGAVNRGKLVNAAELALTGPHWTAIRPEIARNFGTAEMVDGLVWAAERLRAADPQTPLLAVGDISAASGGRAPRHRSHQNGRDADVNFYWTDAAGAPVFSERMTSFDAKGRGAYNGKAVRFDVARNWKLVVAFLSNPYFGKDVRWIFVSRGLRSLLLKEAAVVGADAELIERASKVLAQPPGNSHRNHFHLRIGCSAEDAAKGCKNL